MKAPCRDRCLTRESTSNVELAAFQREYGTEATISRATAEVRASECSDDAPFGRWQLVPARAMHIKELQPTHGDGVAMHEAVIARWLAKEPLYDVKLARVSK